jgi:hypothetical protein
MLREFLGVGLCIGVAVVLGIEPALAAEVSFRNDVMAALAKAGCNAGTCHGNARGKGGFQLSLRGDDPARDYQTLSREWLGRRTNVVAPDQSLLLLKATMQVGHAGGRRFHAGSWEYQTLRAWIAAGMPPDDPHTPRLVGLDVSPTELFLTAPHWEFAFQVRGRFSDGSQRDLTSRAVYETGEPLVEMSADGRGRGLSPGETVVLVRYLDQQVAVPVALIPERPLLAAAALSAHPVDRHIDAKLQRLNLPASPRCDDATFVRRVFFDLIGVPPTAEEARAFVSDAAPDKRTRLIDQLLARPEFADHWALKWADMLRLEEKTLDAKGTQVFHAWLRNAFANDRPLDELVRDLISARGSTYSEPAANFYRALRDPVTRAEAAAQLFLGVRLQCAKCHNHPFDRWTQDDYYSWGNLFARVDYKILENNRRDRNDQHEFDGEQIVFCKPDGDLKDPRTGTPRPPKFLGEQQPVANGEDRLIALAAWMTRPEHDRFAQMLVNRAWRHLMGRGLVEPVDDFRATNPPSHPELLQELAVALRSAGFRLKPLLRLIATSEAYQRSSVPNEWNADDERNYSHAWVRRLPAEQLLDAWMQATGAAVEFRGFPRGTRAGQLPGVGAMLRRAGGPTPADAALQVFGKPPRLQSCECERTEETTLAQAFQIVSGPVVDQLVTAQGNCLAALEASGLALDEQIDTLYWTCLSRPPSAEERDSTRDYLARRQASRAAWEDVLWALVTSHEFLLRR